MEQEVNAWKSNLTNGLIMGSVGIVYSLLVYFFDLTFKPWQSYIGIVIQLLVIYFLLKSYRDNIRHGQISYGQSVGAGVIIYVYYGIIMALFTYLLYTVIDPDLINKSLAYTEESMVKKGMPQESVDAAMAISAKMMKPAFTAIGTLFGSVFFGTIFSLIVSIFIKKEGNPLIDTTSN